jgi:hypothetical protein
MTDMSVEVIPSCVKCGGNDLIGPDDLTDESIITCNSCGEENGTFGELKTASHDIVAKKFTEDLQTTLSEAFDGSDGIKFTKPGNE